MNRIIVIGCCGAGKSTFSKNLKAKTNLPLYHMDHLYWKSGWQEEEQDIFDARLQDILEKDQWILDGNFTRTIGKRLEYAEHVFFFDFPVWLCLWRVLKRVVLSHGQVRDDMAEGCPEHFNLGFMRYIASYKTLTRPQIYESLDKFGKDCKITTFKHPRDVENYLENHDPH